tara:strand:+ start:527 stop:832 length:306 start_codon:yes stop_codon:yes gene_type:complete
VSVSIAADKLLRYYIDARYKNENIYIAKIKAIVSSLESSLNEFKPVFGNFCDEHGMLFSKSDVGHPWQNGLAERTNVRRPARLNFYMRSFHYRTGIWLRGK